jgi:hypothetical protein
MHPGFFFYFPRAFPDIPIRDISFLRKGKEIRIMIRLFKRMLRGFFVDNLLGRTESTREWNALARWSLAMDKGEFAICERWTKEGYSLETEKDIDAVFGATRIESAELVRGGAGRKDAKDAILRVNSFIGNFNCFPDDSVGMKHYLGTRPNLDVRDDSYLLRERRLSCARMSDDKGRTILFFFPDSEFDSVSDRISGKGMLLAYESENGRSRIFLSGRAIASSVISFREGDPAFGRRAVEMDLSFREGRKTLSSPFSPLRLILFGARPAGKGRVGTMRDFAKRDSCDLIMLNLMI